MRINPLHFGVFCNVFLGAVIYYLMPKVLFKTCAPVAATLNAALPYIKNTDCWTNKAQPENLAPFDKPILFTVIVSLSNSMSLLLYWFMSRRQHNKAESSWNWRTFLIIVVPSFLNVSSTCLSFVASTTIAGSVITATKGSRILWTALLGVYVFRNKVLFAYHWLGVVLAMIGVGLVALSAVLGKPSASADPTLGLVLAISGEFVRAFYLVVVEIMVKGKYNVHPVYLSGCMGVWGTLMSFGVLLFCSFGLKTTNTHSGITYPAVGYEDISSSMYMLSHSPQIIVLVSVLFSIQFIFDVGTILTSKFLSAVHTAICSILRSFFT
jgi:drug/metabolite transporter (DMT)-like permease